MSHLLRVRVDYINMICVLYIDVNQLIINGFVSNIQ
eukprot:gene17356-22903_t